MTLLRTASIISDMAGERLRKSYPAVAICHAALMAAVAVNAQVPPCPQTLPTAVLDVAQMPEKWRPLASSQIRARLSQMPWSPLETLAAERSVSHGFTEMRDFLNSDPKRVLRLKDNAIESVLDVSYAASNQPELQNQARAEAASLLEMCARPWLSRPLSSIHRRDFGNLIVLAVYAHQLLPAGSTVTEGLVDRSNRAFQLAAGSLRRATGIDVAALKPGKTLAVNPAFDLNMWTVTLIGAQTVPELKLGDEARAFLQAAWPYLANDPLPNARDFSKGANDLTFYNAAYLGTHIAYIPTGYGRYRLYVEDAPALYRFLRENFYAVLEMGELDLLSEFVDLLRQIGCTEENDLQVRDGTRYLMSLYHAAGDSWMAIPDATERRGHVSEYNLLHKPWTGVAGVRRRVIEPAADGTYGGVFRAAFPAPACAP